MNPTDQPSPTPITYEAEHTFEHCAGKRCDPLPHKADYNKLETDLRAAVEALDDLSKEFELMCKCFGCDVEVYIPYVAARTVLAKLNPSK